MHKCRGIISTIIRGGLIMFLFTFLMVLFGLPWLLFGSTRQIKPVPLLSMSRRVWSQEERAEWLAGHNKTAA